MQQAGRGCAAAVQQLAQSQHAQGSRSPVRTRGGSVDAQRAGAAAASNSPVHGRMVASWSATATLLKCSHAISNQLMALISEIEDIKLVRALVSFVMEKFCSSSCLFHSFSNCWEKVEMKT